VLTKNDKPIRGIHAFVSRRAVVTCLVLAVIFLMPREGRVRTWHVKADSTGEVPTIRVALDSATTGDTVLVGPGTHVVEACMFIEKGIVLTSEAGPTETRIVPESPPINLPYCAFSINEMTNGRAEISGFWFDGSYYGTTDMGVIGIDRCDSVYVINNVFTNYLAGGIAFTVGDSYWIVIENNTFVGGRYAIQGLGSRDGIVRSNIIWAAALELGAFDFVACNCMLDVEDAGRFEPFNFGADPQFCGTVASQNLFLQSDSPCAPGNAPLLPSICDSLKVVGALPVGCGTTPIRSTSWGAFKNIYR